MTSGSPLVRIGNNRAYFGSGNVFLSIGSGTTTKREVLQIHEQRTPTGPLRQPVKMKCHAGLE